MTSPRDGHVCYTKGKVSLDLRLAYGMSFKTHLQVIHPETTDDIILGMVFMEDNHSGFNHTQEGPRKGIEIDRRRFIHGPSF
jgi:hypothetical protein